MSTRRGRGHSAGLDLRLIVETAARMDLDALTMQSVADRLGVTRKALSHHVRDRETLLGLVALAAFGRGFTGADVAAAPDWQQACRTYADRFVAGVQAAGGLVEHLWFGEALTGWFLDPIEALFAQLSAAGFDDEQCTRLVTLLSTVCLGHARDIVQSTREHDRPRARSLRSALESSGSGPHPVLERVAALGVDTYGPEQLDLDLTVLLAGAEHLLRDGERPPGPPGGRRAV